MTILWNLRVVGHYLEFPESDVAVTERGAYDSNANLVSLRRGHDHLLYHQWLPCFSSNCTCIFSKENANLSLVDNGQCAKIDFIWKVYR